MLMRKKDFMKRKMRFTTLSILAVASAAIICILLFAIQRRSLSFSPAVFAESTEPVPNPYCGFYHLYGYRLQEEDTSRAEDLAAVIAEDAYTIALLQINLRDYRTQNLTSTALAQLDTLFSSCEDAGKKLIVRFLYDWDGKASETEPDEISRIFTHMDQVAPYVNAHKNTIFLLQGIFVGECGEMHGSHYMGHDDMVSLGHHLHDCIDPEIFLSVRTPAHYRAIAGTFDPLTSEDAFSGTLASRLGLFNDGMLGSDIDLGTYGTSSISGKTDPDAKGTRQEELAFQNQLCRFVPNGGECVLDNPYNDFENAQADLRAMHVSYLNSDYDRKVLDKWRNSVYTGDDPFHGINGYDYIAAHLGYRYTLLSCTMDYDKWKSRSASLTITLQNSGFSPAYRPFHTTVTLVPDPRKDSEKIICPVEFDNRYLSGGETGSFSFSIDVSGLSKGKYSVYFRMTDPASSDRQIQLANADAQITEDGLLAGILTVSD